jgi:hypothetical protein
MREVRCEGEERKRVGYILQKKKTGDCDGEVKMTAKRRAMTSVESTGW